MIEIWKKIKGFNNYRVSNLGRVKSIARKRRGFHHGKEFHAFHKEKILKPIPRKTSKHTTYAQYNLCEKSKQKCIHGHRMVAQAFIPNPENKPQVNHKDGNGLNNNIKNLEWATGSENSLHAYRVLGRDVWQKGVFGERAPTSRPVLQKTLNGNLVKRWGCGLDAVRDGGFNSCGISRCAGGVNKTHKGFTWEYEKN